jgi:hypothetical protein
MPFENSLPSGADTLLSISGLGGFQYQARGLIQTLSPIKQSSQLARTVNALLIDMSAPQFQKYSSKISCTDVNAPPLDGVWPGLEVTVHCAASLCYPIGGSAGRTEVSGSSSTEGHMTFYRPVLLMRVVNFEQHFDEWKAANGWDLELEEV